MHEESKNKFNLVNSFKNSFEMLFFRLSISHLYKMIITIISNMIMILLFRSPSQNSFNQFICFSKAEHIFCHM